MFGLLSASRPVCEAGPLPIPVSEIKAQCEFTPLPAANDEVQTVVFAMDEEYLDYLAINRQKKS